METRRAKIAAAMVSMKRSTIYRRRRVGSGPGSIEATGCFVGHTLALARGYQLKLDGKPFPANLVLPQLPEDPYVRIKACGGNRRVPLAFR